MMKFAALLAAASYPMLAVAKAGCGESGRCPGALFGTPVSDRARVPTLRKYNAALKKLDIEAVVQDIVDLLTDSQECWPADTFPDSEVGTSYGGLFIRLAWHCSGSYRTTDGRGGCSGGRIRFQPENSWEDNANLDKARGLLWPVKAKYGNALSWGDLFIMAGTASIIHMGGPVSELCAGRIDDADGTKSEPLGPGPEQPPCPVQGDCPEPLGTSTVGLIYVNPEGFMGNPDPAATAVHIRDVFGRMGMNDSETVALIGGGHAFGRSHGACPLGAGLPPSEAPANPWPGLCGSGKGKDTYTSGIDGAWTTDPLKWDNEYFQLLANHGHAYRYAKGPGDKIQWSMSERPDLMMLTTDVALVYDPTYESIVHQFATDINALSVAFAAAWEKLTTNGAEWAREKKCWKPTSDSKFKHPAL